MDLGDNELTLNPIPGKSGKAYMGSYPDGKRIFVKNEHLSNPTWSSQRTNCSHNYYGVAVWQMGVICVLKNG